MEAQAVNCGRTTPQTTPPGKWPTSTAVQPAVTREDICNSSSPTPSISTLMGGVRVENFGLTIPPTTPPGSLLISRAVEVTPLLEDLCKSLLGIPFTSTLVIRMAENCGRTIPPTVRRGEWLIFTVVQPVVTPDLGWKSLSTIRFISQRRTEVPVMNCGRIVRQPLISTRTRVAPSPRGPSVPVCRVGSRLAPTTVRSTAHRPNCGRKPPTRSGPTTAGAQAWPTSTSPSLTTCRASLTV